MEKYCFGRTTVSFCPQFEVGLPGHSWHLVQVHGTDIQVHRSNFCLMILYLLTFVNTRQVYSSLKRHVHEANCHASGNFLVPSSSPLPRFQTLFLMKNSRNITPPQLVHMVHCNFFSWIKKILSAINPFFSAMFRCMYTVHTDAVPEAPPLDSGLIPDFVKGKNE